jgi:putative tricarboxylic transport membrane protein
MTASAPPSAPQQTRNRSELLVALLIGGLGVVVLVDAARLPDVAAQRGPVGPATVPVVVGLALVVCAVFLAVDVLRGGRGEAEGGEDVELDAPTDWRTVALLAAAFLADVALVDRAGWPISGAVLFFGSAYALGSRHYLRDALLAFALSFLTYFLFARGLGIDLPTGILEGILR